MAQIRGTAGYNLGHQNPFGRPGGIDATSDPSPLDAIREQTSKIEDWLETIADPIKPYVALSVAYRGHIGGVEREARGAAFSIRS